MQGWAQDPPSTYLNKLWGGGPGIFPKSQAGQRWSTAINWGRGVPVLVADGSMGSARAKHPGFFFLLKFGQKLVKILFSLKFGQKLVNLFFL